MRETVWFNTAPDVRVPAFVLVPKHAPKPLPAIVAFHDHGGFYLWGREKIVEMEDEHPAVTRFKKASYDGRSFASDLARQGYVVVVIDAFYWGERRIVMDDDPEDWRTRPKNISLARIEEFNKRANDLEALVGLSLYTAGLTWPGVICWDDIRTVDYLMTRPEVDRNRIGCVGMSGGGVRACHLAALDDRVKASVVVGWMCSFPAQLRRHITNTMSHAFLIPALYQHFDYPDIAALAMPRALLVINGERDFLFDRDGLRSSHEKIRACYRKAGVAEKCRTHLYDASHIFNLEMQTEAWKWLVKSL